MVWPSGEKQGARVSSEKKYTSCNLESKQGTVCAWFVAHFKVICAVLLSALALAAGLWYFSAFLTTDVSRDGFSIWVFHTSGMDPNDFREEVISLLREPLGEGADISVRSTRWNADEDWGGCAMKLSSCRRLESRPDATMLVSVRGMSRLESEAVESKVVDWASTRPQISVSQMPSRNDSSVMGIVDGFNAAKHGLRAVLTTPTSLVDASVDSGVFSFQPQALTDGQYQLSLRGPDYYLEAPVDLQLTADEPTHPLLLRALPLPESDDQESTFLWKQDNTLSGRFVMHGKLETVEPFLAAKYNISLSSDWTYDYATRLRRTLDQIPLTDKLTPTTWSFTRDFLNNDVDIEGDTVLISSSAFIYAEPWVTNRPMKAFFSKKLYTACLRFILDNAATKETTEVRHSRRLAYVLQERFNVTVTPDDIPYERLTKGNTDESQLAFQSFSASELFNIAIMFEEMPEGMHKLDNLHYLVRRITTHVHPKYPQFIAVAWTSSGYIEFMQNKMNYDSRVEDQFKTILHEKAHFIYADSQVMSSERRREWYQLSNWTQDSDGQWSSANQLNFVSSYAHGVNPDEDFAESLTTYIRQPARLQQLAPRKHTFLRNHITNGTQYRTVHASDLTFRIFSLWHDLDAPGRIESVTVRVIGKSHEDKTVKVVLSLANETDTHDDAALAYLRLFSVDPSVYEDLQLYPRTGALSHILEGEVTISKYAPTGDWTPENILLRDNVGNERYVNRRYFEWQCVLNNTLEYRQPPTYVPRSVRVELDYKTEESMYMVSVMWQLQDGLGIPDHHCAAWLRMPNDGACSARGSALASQNTYQCRVEFSISKYHRRGYYSVSRIEMENLAGYMAGVNFPGTEVPEAVYVNTADPDLFAPVIDRNSLRIVPTPASFGETKLELSVTVCNEGGSKLKSIHYTLADPSDTHFTDAFKISTPIRLNTDCNKYSTVHILSAGNEPGTWALQAMRVEEENGNKSEKTFNEVVSIQGFSRLV